ncbi:hypothetical protein G7046_g2529 [Stylonectria norvegica]|nr:hypothetical protein G7046_g2529 [Stylonectria norvegica]
MLGNLRNVIVIGGSYVGLTTVKELASRLPSTHRVLLIEPHSHFHHLFAFPRYAIVPDHEHKAFIPYSGVFSAAANPSSHAVVKAKVLSVQPDHVVLDRDWQGSTSVPFEYAVITSGTRLPAPGTMADDEKPLSVEFFKAYQQSVKNAKSIAIVGGGAVGVQMAADLKEFYPEKNITLVHSREQLMPLFHKKIDEIIRDRFEELGVNLITGTRAVVPARGFLNNGRSFELELKDGRKLQTELVIPATGQLPNNQFLQALEPSPGSSILNSANGFIRVLSTLQFEDPRYSNILAAGDIADSGAPKAARPGIGQAQVVTNNIISMIEGRKPSDIVTIAPPAIHLSLGIKQNIIFKNPDIKAGETEPVFKMRDDGEVDMGIGRVWDKRGIKVSRDEDYHL